MTHPACPEQRPVWKLVISLTLVYIHVYVRDWVEGEGTVQSVTEKVQYGNHVLQVEPFGIAQVHREERHGHARSQFSLWLGSNLTIADFALGFLPVSLGLPWSWTILAIVVGNLMGAYVVGLFAAMGPVYGVPQLIIGRHSFGRVGGYLPALFNYVSTIGWFTVNNILGSFGLRVLFPNLQFWQAAVILVCIQGLLAIYGHNLIHAYERVMSVLLAILFAIVSVLALHHTAALMAYRPPLHGSLWPLFAIMVAAVFSYSGSWSPYASDYSRYLPANTPRKGIVGWAFLGSFLATAWLELVGVAVAILAGAQADPIAALHHVMGGFGGVAVIAIILGGTAADALNLYSNGLSAGAFDIRVPRWLLTVIASLIGLGLSLSGSAQFEQNFENFLLMLGYWITPWMGVLLTDFYFFHAHRQGNTDGRSRRSVYLPGLLAFVIGIAAATPFMDGPLYEGPVAKALQGADLSFYVGFLVAALVYGVLRRSMDVRSHRAERVAS
ncbi:cytosine permease [Alicyclobacillaceae bacterium I2511]|nr:cytosine permease [Alicyclobacillaceae bacterium I2511]